MKRKVVLLVFSSLLVTAVFAFSKKLNGMQSEQEIMISEICSRNQTVIYDRDGEYKDYIELYNPTDHPIDLSGYQVSDRSDLKNPYVLEDSVIESNQYLLIFPTGFALSDQELISLLDTENNVVDSVKIPVLADDFSYAKNFDNNHWSIMRATPERENLVEVISQDKAKPEISAPKFSVMPGFYEEPFNLSILAPEDTKVYYTLDGTEPTTESLLYEEPIYIEDVSYKENLYANIAEISTRSTTYIPYHLVDKGNIIRAVAVDSAGRKSKETVGSYFIGFEEKFGYKDIYTISITTNPENLFGFEQGIYVKGKVWAANWDEKRAETDPSYAKNALANYKMEGKGWRRDAHLEVYGKDRQREYEQDIQIGIHGGWSVSHNQKSFNLYAMPEKDGKTYLCPGLVAQKETTMMLRAGGYRDLFSTKFRDVLNQRLVEDRDIGTLQAVPCQLFLNGEYWGLYSFQERIDGCYVESNYGVPKENVIILKN